MQEVNTSCFDDRYVLYVKDMAENVKDEGLGVLIGNDMVDVDTLQLVLQELGYKKGTIGNGDLWYRNIISNSAGYVAELEAIDPEGRTVTFVVQGIDCSSMPLGYCYK